MDVVSFVLSFLYVVVLYRLVSLSFLLSVVTHRPSFVSLYPSLCLTHIVCCCYLTLISLVVVVIVVFLVSRVLSSLSVLSLVHRRRLLSVVCRDAYFCKSFLCSCLLLFFFALVCMSLLLIVTSSSSRCVVHRRHGFGRRGFGRRGLFIC